MSVINWTQMWSKRGGSLSSEKKSAIDQVWSLTEGFQVLAEVGDDPEVIKLGLGISIGDAHPTVSGVYVKDINPQPMNSPIFWVVTVAYEGVKNEFSLKVSWSDATTTEPIDRDITGRAILTFNGEPVEGLSVDVADQVVTIQRPFVSINTYGIAAYRRATNSDTFLGWPPGTARLVGYEASNQFVYGGIQEMWDVTARIQFRQPYANTTAAQAWYKRWRHEGLYVKVGGVIQRARDAMGQEVTKPVLLKADGTQETDPDAAVFNHSQVYGSLPYSGLGLI